MVNTVLLARHKGEPLLQNCQMVRVKKEMMTVVTAQENRNSVPQTYHLTYQVDMALGEGLSVAELFPVPSCWAFSMEAGVVSPLFLVFLPQTLRLRSALPQWWMVRSRA